MLPHGQFPYILGSLIYGNEGWGKAVSIQLELMGVMWKPVELFGDFQLCGIGCFAFEYEGKAKMQS
jgi:hypothetical protein